MNTEFCIGDTVYYIQRWSNNITKGTIVRLEETQDLGTYASIDEGLGTTSYKLTDLYHTKEACIQANAMTVLKQREEYLSQIQSVEDLVQFINN